MAGLVIIVALILSLLWWGTGPSSDETEVYGAQCLDRRFVVPQVYQSLPEFQALLADPSKGPCKVVPLYRSTYKLNAERAEAYYALSFGAPHRLVSCAIMSNKHWVCSYPDGLGRVAVVDGLRAYTRKDILDGTNVFYVRRWQWWFATLYSELGDYPASPALIPTQQIY